MDKKRQPVVKKRRASSARRQAPTPRSRTSRADMGALQQLDRLLERRRRQEQLAAQIPPEVITEQTRYSDGRVLFRFSHTQFGELGQLESVPVPVYMAPVGGCVINVDLFPDDPDDDPHWDERYRLLDMMVTLCTSALPKEQLLRSPLTPLPAAKEQRRLYLRFLACRQANELRAFVDQLSEEHYRLMLAGIQQARLTISGPDQVGVIQRIDEVHRLWTERHQS